MTTSDSPIPVQRIVLGLTAAVAVVSLSGCASGSIGEGSADRPEASVAPVVQPGAPGRTSRTFDQESLENLGGVAITDADIHFMQGMIPHHAQALEMTALVRQRSESEAVRSMALRMEISQRDEIGLMERWLRDRGASVSMEGMGGMGAMPMMPGMLSPDQMNRLGTAEGAEFDRLFLEYMIQHHEGAIIMVDQLFASSGGGQESEIFQFATHVDADQRAEIARMRQLLAESG